ncbi:MAG: cysteine desulfurase family protein [Promethearchaeota archaeon]
MTIKKPIYLDHNATTPVDPAVIDKMQPFFDKQFGNPSSIDHQFGAEANAAVENARKQVAALITCKSSEIVFTSGATEANNLAIVGTYLPTRKRNPHVITASTEHKAVLQPIRFLKQLGARETILSVDNYGMVDPSGLDSAIKDDTLLVSIMFANNEVGTINPIKELVKVSHENGVLFHTDAAQAVGHIPIDMIDLDVDLLSLSAHKMYGPKGIGALVVRKRKPRIKIQPLMMGGGHEGGLRSGTLNVPSIVGLGAAAEIAQNTMKTEQILRNWCKEILTHMQDQIEGVEINGHPEKRLPHNLNMVIPGVQNKALQHSLRKELAFSTGSACESGGVETSHVLLALGCSRDRVNSSIRLGLGRFNTKPEVEMSAKLLARESKRLLELTI